MDSNMKIEIRGIAKILGVIQTMILNDNPDLDPHSNQAAAVDMLGFCVDHLNAMVKSK